MHKRLLPLIVTILLTAVSAQAHATAIAAVVNDNIVTVTDVKDRTNLYLSGAPQPPSPEERKKLEQQVLSKLIDETLELQEAKKLNIEIDPAQVDAGFAFVAKQNNVSPEEFKQRLRNSGVNIDTLYAQIKAEMAWDQIVRRRLRPQITVSEKDIDMTIDQLEQGSGKKQYHIAEIFLKVPNPASENDVREKAEEAIAKIRGGAAFSGIARAISQGPGAGNGGDLGWMQEGQLDPAFEKALATMQPGQITNAIRTANGFHILFLRDMRRTAADPLAEVVAPAAAVQSPTVTLKQIVIPVSPKDTGTIIRAKQARGLALKKEIKSCADMDKKMKDFPAEGTGTLGTGLESALQPALKAVVEKLKVNELSDPIQAPGGWALIIVCSREQPAAPAAPATAETGPVDTKEKARETVADKIGAQRLGKMAEHYLLELREAAFIDKKI